MDDLVSRGDVLAVLKYCEDPIKQIRNLPAAHGVRYGEWVVKSNNGLTHRCKVCSECGYVPPFNPYNSGQCLTRYCSHCGARMVR